MSNSKMREALERIAAWDEHGIGLATSRGSNGVRDYYRGIAVEALAQPDDVVGLTDDDLVDAYIANCGNENGYKDVAKSLRAVADAAVDADRAGRGELVGEVIGHIRNAHYKLRSRCYMPDGTKLYTHPPLDASKAIVPERLKHTPATLTEYDTGYIEGWNACRDALLTTQKEPA